MELVNFGELAIGGVNLILLVLGIVEAAKRLGIKDQGSFILALALGAAFGGLEMALASELVPATAVPWIVVAVRSLGGAVAATGLYDIGKKALSAAMEYLGGLATAVSDN